MSNLLNSAAFSAGCYQRENVSFVKALRLQKPDDDPLIAVHLRMNRAVALRQAHVISESLAELNRVKERLHTIPFAPVTVVMRLHRRRSEAYEAAGDLDNALNDALSTW